VQLPAVAEKRFWRYRPDRETDRRTKKLCQNACSKTGCNADRATDRRNHKRFNDELEENIASPRARSHTNTDFSRAFRDTNQHDVHHANPADKQRNCSDGAKKELQRI